MLLNVLDPNREVKPEFLTYVLLTDDGRVVTGMIASETANSLTIRRADGTTIIVPRNDIDQLRSTGLSFMPEGLEKTVSVEEMSDLLQYLSAIYSHTKGDNQSGERRLSPKPLKVDGIGLMPPGYWMSPLRGCRERRGR